MAKKNLWTSPKGLAQYPWLNTADKHYDSNGKYKCNIRIPVAEAKDLMNQIKEAAKDHFGAKATDARMPFKIDEETGEAVFTASSKFPPKWVDSTGKLIPEGQEPEVYGGSKLKLAGGMYCYENGPNKGLSLQLSGVQVIELAPAKQMLFEAEENGFVAANDNAANDNREPSGDGDEVQYNF